MKSLEQQLEDKFTEFAEALLPEWNEAKVLRILAELSILERRLAEQRRKDIMTDNVLTSKISESIKMSPEWYRDLARELDWYKPEIEPKKPKVPKTLVTVREKVIYVTKNVEQHLEGFDLVAVAVLKGGNLIMQGTQDKDYGIPIYRRKAGGIQINIPNHLKSWLVSRNIGGKYEAKYNEDFKWIETGEKIPEDNKENK